MFGGSTVTRRGGLPSYGGGGADPYDYGTYGKPAKRAAGGGGAVVWAVGVLLVLGLGALGAMLHSTRGQLAQMHEHVSILDAHLLNEKARPAGGRQWGGAASWRSGAPRAARCTLPWGPPGPRRAGAGAPRCAWQGSRREGRRRHG
jgi:hypothetical protein